MRWKPLGDSAVLISLLSRVNASALAAQIEKARPAGFLECVPAFDSVAIAYDPLRTNPESLMHALARLLERAANKGSPPRRTSEIVIPVCYAPEFGPDLAEVAARAGLDVSAVIKLHSSRTYEVRALGFMPGFPYLAGLDKRLHTPRRATPRTRIPAGSVGIGGAQTGVYPLASPGGWNLIGCTPLALFDPVDSQSPTLLKAGDCVRFDPISPEEFAKWK